eukprot:TRINITY_DN49346_c0_g1_i1.p1 TRINITY_DN49346_c0_g1~~TRINITY_DN49346_c0_g1_i1.p1  ORF type:complete len:1075 (+),score=334.67 TRINITY_DN49346_c0_g1_i1:64-3288(+)
MAWRFHIYRQYGRFKLPSTRQVLLLLVSSVAVQGVRLDEEDAADDHLLEEALAGSQPRLPAYVAAVPREMAAEVMSGMKRIADAVHHLRSGTGSKDTPQHPGCYAMMPSGCPKHDWFGHTWTALRDLDAGKSSASAEVCQRQADAINAWCGTHNAQMHYASPAVLREGHDASRSDGLRSSHKGASRTSVDSMDSKQLERLAEAELATEELEAEQKAANKERAEEEQLSGASAPLHLRLQQGSKAAKPKETADGDKKESAAKKKEAGQPKQAAKTKEAAATAPEKGKKSSGKKEAGQPKEVAKSKAAQDKAPEKEKEASKKKEAGQPKAATKTEPKEKPTEKGEEKAAPQLDPEALEVVVEAASLAVTIAQDADASASYASKSVTDAQVASAKSWKSALDVASAREEAARHYVDAAERLELAERKRVDLTKDAESVVRLSAEAAQASSAAASASVRRLGAASLAEVRQPAQEESKSKVSKAAPATSATSEGATANATTPAEDVCPKTHPWAYRPRRGFDMCCQTGDDCDGHEGLNSGRREDRSSCCLDNNFVPCLKPPCADNPAAKSGTNSSEGGRRTSSSQVITSETTRTSSSSSSGSSGSNSANSSSSSTKRQFGEEAVVEKVDAKTLVMADRLVKEREAAVRAASAECSEATRGHVVSEERLKEARKELKAAQVALVEINRKQRLVSERVSVDKLQQTAGTPVARLEPGVPGSETQLGAKEECRCIGGQGPGATCGSEGWCYVMPGCPYAWRGMYGKWSQLPCHAGAVQAANTALLQKGQDLSEPFASSSANLLDESRSHSITEKADPPSPLGESEPLKKEPPRPLGVLDDPPPAERRKEEAPGEKDMLMSEGAMSDMKFAVLQEIADQNADKANSRMRRVAEAQQASVVLKRAADAAEAALKATKTQIQAAKDAARAAEEAQKREEEQAARLKDSAKKARVYAEEMRELAKQVPDLTAKAEGQDPAAPASEGEVEGQEVPPEGPQAMNAPGSAALQEAQDASAQAQEAPAEVTVVAVPAGMPMDADGPPASDGPDLPTPPQATGIQSPTMIQESPWSNSVLLEAAESVQAR